MNLACCRAPPDLRATADPLVRFLSVRLSVQIVQQKCIILYARNTQRLACACAYVVFMCTMPVSYGC